MTVLQYLIGDKARGEPPMPMQRWLNPNIGRLVPYEPGRPIEDVARDLGMDPQDISKLASNENPLGPSPKAVRAMKKFAGESHLYPDGGGFNLRQRLATHLGVTRDNLILGAGSNEIIEFVGHACMGPNTSVVASQYAFVVYKLVAGMFGATFIEVPAKDYGHDLKAMEKAIRPDTSVICLCNPNNPTGTLISEKELTRFIERVPEDKLIILDEAYYEICLGKMPDALRYVKEGRKNVLVLRTFSKAYGLAGMRIGYGVGHPEVITALQKARQPFNTTRLGQQAAEAALDDQGFVRRSRALFRKGRDYMEQELAAMGLDFVHSYANFMLIKVGDGAKVCNELTKLGVIARPVGGYSLPTFLRISFGTMEQNEKFIRCLKQVMKR
jgi:histidinol-phosphate aminotransferase